MTEHAETRYGVWAGCPDGVAEDPHRCIIAVWSTARYKSHQCGNARGHGRNGLFCRRHANRLAQREQGQEGQE